MYDDTYTPTGSANNPVKEIVSPRRDDTQGGASSLSLLSLARADKLFGPSRLVPRSAQWNATCQDPKLRLLPRYITLHYVTLHLSLIRTLLSLRSPFSSVPRAPIRLRAFVAMVTPYPATWPYTTVVLLLSRSFFSRSEFHPLVYRYVWHDLVKY